MNKSNNFSHFIDRDYGLMASLVSKEERNLGALIFSKIKRYRYSGTNTTPMPYPQLISLILRANKIWYLELNEPIERLLIVRRNQIEKLGIDLPLRHLLVTTPKKKKASDSKATKMDDTQSSVLATSNAPSFLSSTIQMYLKEVL